MIDERTGRFRWRRLVVGPRRLLTDVWPKLVFPAQSLLAAKAGAGIQFSQDAQEGR